jgi:hypothetical protein
VNLSLGSSGILKRKKSWEFNEGGKFSKLQFNFPSNPIMFVDETREEIMCQLM